MSGQIVSKVKSRKGDKDSDRAEASTMTEGPITSASPQPMEKVTAEVSVSSSGLSKTQPTSDAKASLSAPRPKSLGVVQVYPPLEYPPLDALTPPMSPAPDQPLTPPPEVMGPPTAPPPSPGQLTLWRSAAAVQRARAVTSRPTSGQIDSSSGSDTAPADSTQEVWV